MPQVRAVDKVDRTIHSDMAQDRDANGQQAFGENQKEKPPMSEEQLKKVIEHLMQLPAVKEHKWTVELISEDGKKFVQIKDHLGTLIRRIPEVELWTLGVDEPSNKGQLLKRAA